MLKKFKKSILTLIAKNFIFFLYIIHGIKNKIKKIQIKKKQKHIIILYKYFKNNEKKILLFTSKILNVKQKINNFLKKL